MYLCAKLGCSTHYGLGRVGSQRNKLIDRDFLFHSKMVPTQTAREISYSLLLIFRLIKFITLLSWTTTLTKLLRCTGSTPIIGKRPKSEQDKLMINELRVQISIKLFIFVSLSL